MLNLNFKLKFLFKLHFRTENRVPVKLVTLRAEPSIKHWCIDQDIFTKEVCFVVSSSLIIQTFSLIVLFQFLTI